MARSHVSLAGFAVTYVVWGNPGVFAMRQVPPKPLPEEVEWAASPAVYGPAGHRWYLYSKCVYSINANKLQRGETVFPLQTSMKSSELQKRGCSDMAGVFLPVLAWAFKEDLTKVYPIRPEEGSGGGSHPCPCPSTPAPRRSRLVP